jgi:hypothetical protein
MPVPTFQPADSVLHLALWSLPQVEILALPGTESLVSLGNQPELSGHRVSMSNSVWSTINFGPGTSLFTGIPLISNLTPNFLTTQPLIPLFNDAGIFEDGFESMPSISAQTTHFAGGHVPGAGGGHIGPTFGGISRLNGQIYLELVNGLAFGIPMVEVAGGPLGSTADTAAFASGHPWVTSTVQISQVTSNIITLPDRAPCWPGCATPTPGTRVQGVAFTLNVASGETQMTLSTAGGFVSISRGSALERHTVTVSGSNALISGGQAGRVTVVSPIWIDTGTLLGNLPGGDNLGNLPGVVKLTFEFVPEPGSVVLLLSGVVGLAVIGRRRIRR